MKLPSQKRINENDFDKEYQDLVKELASVLNTDIENIYLALSKRLSITDNVDCTVKTVTVLVDASGIPTTTTSFQLDRTGGTQVFSKIKGITVITATNNTNSTVYPTSQPFISWTQNEGRVTINHISGIPASNLFSLVLIAWN